MKKYLVLFICLFVCGAFAKPNIFCKNEDSLDDFCMVASNVMYEGYMKGFTGSVKKYQKNNSKEDALDDSQILKEAQELIPYNVFHSAFLYCGEKEKSMKEGQMCLVKELQKYVVIKVKEQQDTAKEETQQ